MQGHYDLIVFPEGALDTDPEQDPELRERLVALAEKHGASVLVNARTPGDDGQSRNTEPHVRRPTASGRASTRSSTSCRSASTCRGATRSSFIGELRQIPYDFEAGDRTGRVPRRRAPDRSVICFESAFGPLVRDSVRNGAEVVVVSTNNRSYHRSGNTEQHLANSQMRAAETARAVLQASVSGISAVIDPDGTVHDTTDLFEKAIVRADGADHDGRDALRALRRLGRAAHVGARCSVVTVVAIRRPVRGRRSRAHAPAA